MLWLTLATILSLAPPAIAEPAALTTPQALPRAWIGLDLGGSLVAGGPVPGLGWSGQARAAVRPARSFPMTVGLRSEFGRGFRTEEKPQESANMGFMGGWLRDWSTPQSRISHHGTWVSGEVVLGALHPNEERTRIGWGLGGGLARSWRREASGSTSPPETDLSLSASVVYTFERPGALEPSIGFSLRAIGVLEAICFGITVGGELEGG